MERKTIQDDRLTDPPHVSPRVMIITPLRLQCKKSIACDGLDLSPWMCMRLSPAAHAPREPRASISMLDAAHVVVAHFNCAVSLSRQPVSSSAARCHSALQGQLISCCETRVGLSHGMSLGARLTPKVATAFVCHSWLVVTRGVQLTWSWLLGSSWKSEIIPF